jgi:hypothetical protein
VLLSSGDSFPHLIQKPRSQLGFVTYLLNYLRTSKYSLRFIAYVQYFCENSVDNLLAPLNIRKLGRDSPRQARGLHVKEPSLLLFIPSHLHAWTNI